VFLFIISEEEGDQTIEDRQEKPQQLDSICPLVAEPRSDWVNIANMTDNGRDGERTNDKKADSVEVMIHLSLLRFFNVLRYLLAQLLAAGKP